VGGGGGGEGNGAVEKTDTRNIKLCKVILVAVLNGLDQLSLVNVYFVISRCIWEMWNTY